MRFQFALLLSLCLHFIGRCPTSGQNATRLDCPQRCMCFTDTVRCMFQKLRRVPRIPANTTILDLRFNEIVDIRTEAFHDLKELHTLLLNDNRIKDLAAGAFLGAPNLRILHLHKNRLERIEPGAFAGLPKLEQLYLHHNHLGEIRKGTFNDLPALERLFLHGNEIRRVPADGFRNVGPMTRLRLDSNALVCDCELLWLVQRFQEKPAEMAATCHSPANMRGRSVSSMRPVDFHCSMPTVMEGPEDAVVRIGETMLLRCRVSGEPRPEIKWTKDSQEVRMDDRRYFLREDGTLVIKEATREDAGLYECMAVNGMGLRKSRRARATVTVPEAEAETGTGSETEPTAMAETVPEAVSAHAPSLRFVELPESRTVSAGTDVEMRCRAVAGGDDDGAEPRVRVEWWRNGRLITTNGRTRIEADGELLRIIAAKETDAARYVCRASDPSGFAETSADLRVISADTSPPRISYEPRDMEVEVGATVELPCRAVAVPKPVIRWKKDGTAIENIDLVARTRMSRAGSLYLRNVTAQDAGRYECTATNPFGRATAQALVRLRPVASANPASDLLVIRAFNEASAEIDRAINETLVTLLRGKGSGPSSGHKDLFRLGRYPDASGRAAARPAEIFERTLLNVRRLVEMGTVANGSQEFRYEEVLTPEQVREIERLSGCTAHRRQPRCADLCFHNKYRSIDGTCNNLRNPSWGSSYTGFRRILRPIYENGFSTPVGWQKGRLYHGYPKPAARLVSTSLISTGHVTSDESISHMVMQWGQFLDHDMDHALPSVSSESWDGIDCKKSCENAAPCFPMEVPPGDPRITNRRCIDFVRTSAVCGSGETSPLWGRGIAHREQLNQLTSYIDASQVYGYDEELARQLRDTRTDHGLLREGPRLPGHKPLLPYAAPGQFVDCRRDPLESSINCFVAGDIRANEQVGLLAMHTLWMREHNRIASELRELNPHWNGERLYQEARKIVGAEMQHITYRHWLPRILGDSDRRPAGQLLAPYRGYDERVDASISNVFASAALRFGHSLIQPRLERLDGDFRPIAQGPLALRDAFFAPWRLVEEGGVDPLLRGMFFTPAKLKMPEQNLNAELTEQLFRTAHAVALDLAAMNIQRARDHGIPGYLEWREFCNSGNASRPPPETFDDLADVISSPAVRQKLRELYGHPGNLDVWVGGILEDQLPGAKVGPLFACLLAEQFQRARDGDRFWYENPSVFKAEQLAQIQRTSLARVLCDNGDAIDRVQLDVFLMPNETNPLRSCEDIPRLDLRFWSDCCENCDTFAPTDNALPRFRRSTAARYSEAVNSLDSDSQPDVQQIHRLRAMIDETERQSQKLRTLADDLAHQVEELRSRLERIETSR